MFFAALLAAADFTYQVLIHFPVQILNFLGWSDSLEEQFPKDVRIVLAAANFSKELTTSVMWLNKRDSDIRCVRLQPYRLGEELLLDIEQIIPLPEAEEYQVKVREQASAQRAAASSSKDKTKYQFLGEPHNTTTFGIIIGCVILTLSILTFCLTIANYREFSFKK